MFGPKKETLKNTNKRLSKRINNQPWVTRLWIPREIARNIIRRIPYAIDKLVRREQGELRKGTEDVNQTFKFSLRNIIEQCTNGNMNNFTVIDFRKAFDIITKESFWGILGVYGSHLEYINDLPEGVLWKSRLLTDVPAIYRHIYSKLGYRTAPLYRTTWCDYRPEKGCAMSWQWLTKNHL